MPWPETMRPVGMLRVGLLMPTGSLRDVLVAVADEGTVDFEDLRGERGSGGATPAATRLQNIGAAAQAPAISPMEPDLDACERGGRADIIAGEAQVERRALEAVSRGQVSGLAGWVPEPDLARLVERIRSAGGVVVPLEHPPGVDPPTLASQQPAAREFAPLVETYGVAPYADLDPSILAGVAYVLMFGMMFADVGHGALLLMVAVAVRLELLPVLSRLRRVWLFLAGAGLASMAFGALYGEFFGPTTVLPVVWLAPLDHPVPLLGAAVGVGALLLAGAYALGSINRFREGGWRLAVYAPSGLAGTALFLGLGGTAAGVYFELWWLSSLGGLVAVAGLAVAFVGLFASAGGGGAGAARAAVELFDMVARLFSNLVSFVRLAAFGMTHAALGEIIWTGATGLGGHGPLGVVAAGLVFLVGNALAFGLEGLVAGVQALRLEYYELFSRIFDQIGRPYRPWHVPLADTEVTH